MMRLHLYNSKNISRFSFLPQNLKPTINSSTLFTRTEKRIKQIARRNVHPEYENNISAHEIPKPEVVRSWKNILEGKPCKLVLFLTHWPLSGPGLAGALICSRVAVVSTHHVL